MISGIWKWISKQGWFTKRRPQFDRIGAASAILIALASWSEPAHAADWEGSIQNLVNAFVGRILPTIALGYVAKNALAHIQNKPEARDESVRVALGVISLIGIKGVWSWLQSQVR